MNSSTKPITSSIIIDLMPITMYTKAAHRWQDLEQRLGNNYLTNSWRWTHSWLNSYGALVRPIFAFGMLGGQPIGAALITQSTQYIAGIPVPCVHLGTAGEPGRESTYIEYNRLLVAPEHLDAFACSLVDVLLRQFRWTELHFDGFQAQHGAALLRAGERAGLRFQVTERPCPSFDFLKAAQEGHKDVVTALGRKARSNVLRSQRLLESTYGEPHSEWATTPEQALDILIELVELHQQRWQGVKQPGAFVSQRVQHYHVDLINALGVFPQGRILVFRLKYGEMTVGCLFGFVDHDGHVQGTKTGFSSFEDSRLSPGMVTHVACITECMRYSQPDDVSFRGASVGDLEEQLVVGHRRLRKYDFLAGDSLYKKQLSNGSDTLVWAIAARGPRSWVIEKGRFGKKLLRRLSRLNF